MPTPGNSDYPTALDTSTNLPDVSGANLNDTDPYKVHSNLTDTQSQAILALENKLGIGSSSAGTATTGQTLVKQVGGTTIWAGVPTRYPIVMTLDSWSAITSGGTPILGTYRWYFENPATLVAATKCSVGTPPAVTPIQIRINKNGSSIISGTNYPQINVGANVQTNTPVFTTTSFAANDYLTIDLFQGDGAQLMIKLFFTEP
jgi:hypothetical protein